MITSNGVLSKNDEPCSTFQPMTDNSNDIDHYTPFTFHVVSIISNCWYKKNYSPCSTFLPMKDHYKHIELYAALTDDVLSVDYNGDFTLYPRREEGG